MSIAFLSSFDIGVLSWTYFPLPQGTATDPVEANWQVDPTGYASIQRLRAETAAGLEKHHLELFVETPPESLVLWTIQVREKG